MRMGWVDASRGTNLTNFHFCSILCGEYDLRQFKISISKGPS